MSSLCVCNYVCDCYLGDSCVMYHFMLVVKTGPLTCNSVFSTVASLRLMNCLVTQLAEMLLTLS